MGADRLKKINDAAKRYWRETRRRMSEPTLFSQLTDVQTRFGASVRPGYAPAVGEKLLLQLVGEHSVLTQGPSIVADCGDLPKEIIEGRDLSAIPLCVEIVEINPLSSTVDLVVHQDEDDRS
jgi:hypothetical protein